MIEPFISAVPVLEQLETAGFEAYFVGGSVRDYLLNKPINDVDIASSATPEEVKKVFLKTVDVGIEHGTVLVLFNGQSYEITTFRTEGEYQDFRRPKEVSFIRNLTEDLQRRDFTMNAMAMDKDGNIIDPFQGKSAIKNKLIQTVGSPYERFQEDALRMMRAARFVSQLGFRIDDKTYNALVHLADLLEKIAVERKQAEFSKLLSGDHRKQGLQLLLDSNLIAYLPGLETQHTAIQEMIGYELNPLNPKEMWALLGYCLMLEGKEIEVFYRNWRLPLKEIRELQLILTYLKKRFLSEWSNFDLYSAGMQIFTASESLYLAIKGEEDIRAIQPLLHRYQELPMKDRSEMDVTGIDLMNWYKKSGGPWLKEILLSVEEAIIAGKVKNRKQGIKEWLMECNHK